MYDDVAVKPVVEGIRGVYGKHILQASLRARVTRSAVLHLAT